MWTAQHGELDEEPHLKEELSFLRENIYMVLEGRVNEVIRLPALREEWGVPRVPRTVLRPT